MLCTGLVQIELGGLGFVLVFWWNASDCEQRHEATMKFREIKGRAN